MGPKGQGQKSREPGDPPGYLELWLAVVVPLGRRDTDLPSSSEGFRCRLSKITHSNSNPSAASPLLRILLGMGSVLYWDACAALVCSALSFGCIVDKKKCFCW